MTCMTAGFATASPPFLYTSHVRTTRVRTHDVTGYNLTLTSGTRRVRTQHDVTPLFSTPYHVTSGPRWGGGGNTTDMDNKGIN
jgi:hypothetical protein